MLSIYCPTKLKFKHRLHRKLIEVLSKAQIIEYLEETNAKTLDGLSLHCHMPAPGIQPRQI